MKNTQFEVKGNKLIITVDLKADKTPSKTGKSLVIGSTEGNVSVPGFDDIKVGLNVYTSNPAK